MAPSAGVPAEIACQTSWELVRAQIATVFSFKKKKAVKGVAFHSITLSFFFWKASVICKNKIIKKIRIRMIIILKFLNQWSFTQTEVCALQKTSSCVKRQSGFSFFLCRPAYSLPPGSANYGNHNKTFQQIKSLLYLFFFFFLFKRKKKKKTLCTDRCCSGWAMSFHTAVVSDGAGQL